MINQIIFTDRSRVSIQNEINDSGEFETGGILLGSVDGDKCYIIENIPPGYDAIHKSNEFEYNHSFVEYLANHIAGLYKNDISLIGLWHTHPGNDNKFSYEDTELNAKFLDVLGSEIVSIIFNINSSKELMDTAYVIHRNMDEMIIEKKVECIWDSSLVPRGLLGYK